jgi:hypothetical protein
MVAPIPSNNRTKIGNGLRLYPRPKFGGPDMRSREGRRLAEVHADLLAELGRQPSESEITLIQLAASLKVRIETMSAELASGRRVDAETVTGLSGEYRRVLRGLGLGGGAPAEDRGPSLSDLLAEHARGGGT